MLINNEGAAINNMVCVGKMKNNIFQLSSSWKPKKQRLLWETIGKVGLLSHMIRISNLGGKCKLLLSFSYKSCNCNSLIHLDSNKKLMRLSFLACLFYYNRLLTQTFSLELKKVTYLLQNNLYSKP